METNLAEAIAPDPSDPDEMVLYLIINKSLKMSKGKLVAQTGHTITQLIHKLTILHEMPHTYNRPSFPDKLDFYSWINGSQTKVALSSDNKSDTNLAGAASLISIESAANTFGIYNHLVQDEGRTEIPAGSYTVLGIEPLPKSHPFVQEYLSKLPLY